MANSSEALIKTSEEITKKETGIVKTSEALTGISEALAVTPVKIIHKIFTPLVKTELSIEH